MEAHRLHAHAAFGHQRSVLCDLGIGLARRPRASGFVRPGQLRQRSDRSVGVVLGGIRRGDLTLILGCLRRVGFALEQHAVRLHRALVARLIEERAAQPAQHFVGVFLAADFAQESVQVGRGVALVLGKNLDQILERLVLQLEQTAPPLTGDALQTAGQVEHLPKSQRRVLAAPQLPQAPCALEERQVGQLALGMLAHLFVFLQRRLVVERAGEMPLGKRHVRIGHEATLRKLIDDAAIGEQRFARAAGFDQRVRLHVQHQIVAIEVAVLGQDSLVQR